MFANETPDESKLSQDRWSIHRIDEDKRLYPRLPGLAELQRQAPGEVGPHGRARVEEDLATIIDDTAFKVD